MNMILMALMCVIGTTLVGSLVYALIYSYPILLIAFAAIAGVAFAPWHRWP
jgi:hypothetical protein